MNEADIRGRIDALRSLSGDGKPANGSHDISEEKRFWILLDSSSAKAKKFIAKYQSREKGRTHVALLDLLDVDAASMTSAFGSRWISKFTSATGALCSGFYCREYYNIWFVTPSDDGLASAHAPEKGVIVNAGSKEAKDLTARINTFIRERERQKAAQTPARGRMAPIARPTPSPSDSGTRKRKHDDD